MLVGGAVTEERKGVGEVKFQCVWGVGGAAGEKAGGYHHREKSGGLAGSHLQTRWGRNSL